MRLGKMVRERTVETLVISDEIVKKTEHVLNPLNVLKQKKKKVLSTNRLEKVEL